MTHNVERNSFAVISDFLFAKPNEFIASAIKSKVNDVL
jgi:hypothetical protein